MSILPISGSIGSIKTPKALMTVGTLTFAAAVISIKGSGGAAVQVTQDFKGTPFLVLFGNRISEVTVLCGDMTLVTCTGTPGKLTTVTAIEFIKKSIERGQLEQIHISSGGSTVIKGFLTGITFETALPMPQYILHIVGALGE